MKVRYLLPLISLLCACGPAKLGTVRIPAAEHDSPSQIAKRAATNFCPNDPTYAGRFQKANTPNLDPSNWSWVLPSKLGIEITLVECKPAETAKPATKPTQAKPTADPKKPLAIEAPRVEGERTTAPRSKVSKKAQPAGKNGTTTSPTKDTTAPQPRDEQGGDITE